MAPVPCFSSVGLLFTEVADGLPVVLMDGEPLAVSWADVDVH